MENKPTVNNIAAYIEQIPNKSECHILANFKENPKEYFGFYSVEPEIIKEKEYVLVRILPLEECSELMPVDIFSNCLSMATEVGKEIFFMTQDNQCYLVGTEMKRTAFWGDVLLFTFARD